MSELQNIFQTQRLFRWEVKTWHLDHRKNLLRLLKSAIERNQADICQALAEDFQKPEMETLMTEIYPVLEEIRFTLKNLKKWARPRPVSSGLLLFGTKSEVHHEPLGNVLIIAPWNYPFSLAMVPLVSALAAGNTVILKPSELTPKTSRLIEKILSELFESSLVAVIQGGKEVSQALLELPFDHIFFTGSGKVGKLVMAAASNNLTSVTLELGGKSPTVVHSSCDLPLAAKKVIWGKLINGGQTCVAPDYVLVEESIADNFTELLREEIYRQNEQQKLAQIITPQHQSRLLKLVSEAESAGAQTILPAVGRTERTVTPSILRNPSAQSDLMKEEIFGPILPIMTFKDLDEVVHYINDRPKPLALYVFSKDRDFTEAVLERTSSGGVCVNDTLIHLGNPRLPFGGVGESGFGSYHGEYGFETFSHRKSVLRQGILAKFTILFYPPYNEKKLKWFRFLMRL